MDDSAGMHRAEAVADVRDASHGLARGHRSRGSHLLPQRSARDVLHDQIALVTAHPPGVDLNDVGMVQFGQEMGISPQCLSDAGPKFIFRNDLQRLQSHLSVEIDVLGQPHGAVSPFPITREAKLVRKRIDQRIRGRCPYGS